MNYVTNFKNRFIAVENSSMELVILSEITEKSYQKWEVAENDNPKP